MSNEYYESKFNERQEELENLVVMEGMTPYQIIGYYIHHLEEVEYANKKLVEYLGEDKTREILENR